MEDGAMTREERRAAFVAAVIPKRPEPPKLTVVQTNELSAEVLRQRAERAAEDAARAAREEIERAQVAGARLAAQEHEQRLARLQGAIDWHVERQGWHAMQARHLKAIDPVGWGHWND
jgi:hypothetical protein